MSQSPKTSEGEKHAYWHAYTAQREIIDEIYKEVLATCPNADLKKLNELELSFFKGQSPHDLGIKAVIAYNEERGLQALKTYREARRQEAKAKRHEEYIAKVLQMW